MFLKGFVVGLVLCAPMGPIGMLIIWRTFVSGRLAGLVSVLGASTLDGLYCLVATLGVACIADFLRNEQRLLTFLGGLVLIALGLRLFFSKPPTKPMNGAAKGLKDAFLSSFLLMLTNPMPILLFTAAFTALGVHGGDYAAGFILSAGVFTGSALWGPVLVASLGILGRHVGPRHMLILNKISGLFISFFGMGAGLLAMIC
jgi:threonine/homoserine/homoserine lactone efflux protein